MPVDTTFTFNLAWSNIVGVFNGLAPILGPVVAIAVAVLIIFGVVAFIQSSISQSATTKRAKADKSSHAPVRPKALSKAILPPPPAPAIAMPVAENPTEQKILDVLTGGNPIHVDDLGEKTEIPAPELSATLMMMELTGKIENTGTMHYSAISTAPATESTSTAPTTIKRKRKKSTTTTPTTTSNTTIKHKRKKSTTPNTGTYKESLINFIDYVLGLFGVKRRRSNPNYQRPYQPVEGEPVPPKEYVPVALRPHIAEPPMPTESKSINLDDIETTMPRIDFEPKPTAWISDIFDDLETTMPRIDFEPKPTAWISDIFDDLETTMPRIDFSTIEEPPAPNQPGHVVKAYAPSDPFETYLVHYELRELADLEASNDVSGAINPAYPAELQPRDRTRAGSLMQITGMAQSLNPDALLTEFSSLDRGAPIVGEDGAVESGNGRIMALRLAESDVPARYEAYTQRLRETAESFGLDPAQVDDYESPVLVRRVVGDYDRVLFAQRANESATLQMSDTEQSRTDAQRIGPGDIIRLDLGDDSDKSLRQARNRGFIASFMADLPENERGGLVDRDGGLTQSGLSRVKSALFYRVYDSDRLSDRIFESTDNDIKNVTNGLMGSLGQLAIAEEMIRRGERDESLSIADDLAIATEKLSSIKSEGVTVDEYLKQGKLFGPELTDDQERILIALDERKRSGKKVRELVSAWGAIVDDQPNPKQNDMFDDDRSDRRSLIERWLNPVIPQTSMF